MSKTKKRNGKQQERPRPSGWSTSDADEIERRRLRAASEVFQIQSLTPGDNFFGLYRVDSKTGQTYRVEIRSLAEPINSCNCPDHRINSLGTCKHIEATLIRLQHRRKRTFKEAAVMGGPYVEIFLDLRDNRARIRWPGNGLRRSKARDLLALYFTEKNILAGKSLDLLPAMQRRIEALHLAARRRIRFSQELNVWLELLDGREQHVRSRQHFETQVAAGSASLDLVKHPLAGWHAAPGLHGSRPARG